MPKYSIILAEDSSADIFLTRKALTDNGLHYELYLVDDVDSLSLLMTRIGDDIPIPNLLLIDLNLPKADGAQLIQMIRQHPGCAAVPVVVVTSSDSPRDRSRMAELRVYQYFRKPSNLAEFMRLGDIARSILENRDGAVPSD
jgi:CheY-like chemotaxis protein